MLSILFSLLTESFIQQMMRITNDDAHYVLCSLDKKKFVVLIALDLSAAFDTVDHSKLCDIHENRLGVKKKALSWIKSYLSDRTQRVLINGVFSNYIKLKVGVLQGSVLGPFLFSIYLIPLRDILNEIDVDYHIYAEDSTLYFTIDNVEAGTMKAQQVVYRVHEWFSSMNLKMNEDKIEFMFVRSRRSRITIPDQVVLANECLDVATHFRSLGFVLDQYFTFEKQINLVCESRHYQLRRI